MQAQSQARDGTSRSLCLAEIALESPSASIADLTESFMSINLHNTPKQMNSSETVIGDAVKLSPNSDYDFLSSRLLSKSVKPGLSLNSTTEVRAASRSIQHKLDHNKPLHQPIQRDFGAKRQREFHSSLGASVLASSSRDMYASNLARTVADFKHMYITHSPQSESLSTLLHALTETSKDPTTPSQRRAFQAPRSALSLQPTQLPPPMLDALKNKTVGTTSPSASLVCSSGIAIVGGAALTLLVCVGCHNDQAPALLLQLYSDFAHLPLAESKIVLPRENSAVVGAFAPGGSGQCVIAVNGAVLLLDLASSYNAHLQQEAPSSNICAITTWALVGSGPQMELKAACHGDTIAPAPTAIVSAVAATSGTLSAMESAGRALLVVLGHSDCSCSAIWFSGSGKEVSPTELKIATATAVCPTATDAQSRNHNTGVQAVHLSPLSGMGHLGCGILLHASMLCGCQYHTLCSSSRGCTESQWTRLVCCERKGLQSSTTSRKRVTSSSTAAYSKLGQSFGSAGYDQQGSFTHHGPRVHDVALSSSDAQAAPAVHPAPSIYEQHLKLPVDAPPPPLGVSSGRSQLHTTAIGATQGSLHQSGGLLASTWQQATPRAGSWLLGSPGAAQFDGTSSTGGSACFTQVGGGGVFANSYFLADSSSSFEADGLTDGIHKSGAMSDEERHLSHGQV